PGAAAPVDVHRPDEHLSVRPDGQLLRRSRRLAPAKDETGGSLCDPAEPADVWSDGGVSVARSLVLAAAAGLGRRPRAAAADPARPGRRLLRQHCPVLAVRAERLLFR